MKKTANLRKKGFTLIEYLIVIAIISLVVVFSLPQLFGTREKAELSKEVDGFVAALVYARQQSIAAFEGHSYSVEINPPKNYTILPENRQYDTPKGIDFTQPPIPTTVSFDKLTGKTNGQADFVISSQHFEISISVSREGVVSHTAAQRK